jgi:aromatic ring-opening dioxygenase catalytic subunit (LigB family)
VRGLDPALHLALGKALRELMREDILVIGSGFSFHNMGAFFQGEMNAPDPANDIFQDWLIEVCAGPLAQSDRERRLIEWQRAPSARYCHPREEHLLPLLVCVGMAGKAGTVIFDDYIAGKRAVAFLW